MGAWLGIVALLLHAAVPFAQGIPLPTGGTGEEPGYLVTCNASGAKTMPVEGDGSPERDGRSTCPVCLISALDKTLCLVSVATPMVPPAHARGWRPAPVGALVGGLSLRSGLARAPPRLA